MGLLRIPDLLIDKENPDEGIKKLVKKIKPKWNVDNLVTEVVVGGYSSKMFKCHISDNSEDAIIVRLQHLMDRFEEWKGEVEIQAIEHMSKIGHFTEIHAIFSNGYCYQFIPGKPVINIRLKTGKITEEHLEAIAEELAFVHSIRLPNVDYENVNYFAMIKETINKVDIKNPPKNAPSKETILQEMDIVENYLKSLDTPIALCHGDPHPGNFVWNDETKKMIFVDWEMSRIGCEFQEVAHFIMTLQLFGPAVTPNSKIEVPENFEEKFIKLYFDARLKYKILKQYSFDEFKELIQKFKLSTTFGGVIFPLIVPDLLEEVTDGADLTKFYDLGLNGYLQMKKQFLGTDRFG